MPKPILVGVDPGGDDAAPLHFAIAAARFTGAPLVVGAVHADPAALERLEHGHLEAGLPDAGAAADVLDGGLAPADVEVEVRALPGTSVSRALHHAAEDLDAGLVVVGSARHATLGHAVRGSTADRLLHGAPCPVAVVPRGWEPAGRLTQLGVAYTVTPEGRAALQGAVALAERTGARLRVLSAATPHGFSQTQGGGSMTEATTFAEVGSALRVEVERQVAEATAGVTGVEVEPDVSVQDPAEFLVAASEQLDLLVCGSRGYGPRRAVLLGGVSRHVTSESRCPVIVLARGVDGALESLIGARAGATA